MKIGREEGTGCWELTSLVTSVAQVKDDKIPLMTGEVGRGRGDDCV